MADFNSWRSYYRFVDSVLRSARFIHDPETRSFLDTVVETAVDRTFVLPESAILYRAQIGCAFVSDEARGLYLPEVEVPYPPDRMKPLPGLAREGRANPPGITYLYLASDLTTAMSELRPWIAVNISLGTFTTVRELRLVDCAREHSRMQLFLSEPPLERWRDIVWGDIDRAFARPVSADEQTTAYIPTQILAEVFRTAGYDGVIHKSSVGPGHNFILFDLGSAELRKCQLYSPRAIEYRFEEQGNPYFVQTAVVSAEEQ